MNNLQDTLLFPFRDAEARKQFLFACLVTLAGFIIPIIPFIFLMGYNAKIMRQIIEERKDPSMPNWQESDPSEMFMDGLRLYGSKLILMLPAILAIGLGVLSMTGGSIAASVSINDNGQSFAPIGIPFIMVGFALIMLFSILVIPYAVIISTVGPHVAKTRSFASAFQFKDWWQIFRNAPGQFVLAYVVTMATSWILTFAMQIAMMTIVLICIIPFVMIPYTAYITLLRNTLFAQAYVAGLDNQQAV